ncbi:hypothetical protein OG592_44550 (plasmid) [Streptomyces avidinii]|uniref:hypothetical protein n=1 Tax=Streptomyces avidinii TaxID=1895 RepID=UPI003868DD61|nr:hypothetical protein OG592_44550 [Streptomyces avidinii]
MDQDGSPGPSAKRRKIEITVEGQVDEYDLKRIIARTARMQHEDHEEQEQEEHEDRSAAYARVRGHVRRTRTPEQRVMLALIFLPPSQRDRYRREWLAEMTSMDPVQAAEFALELLCLAPKMGFTFLISRLLGRRAA